MFVYMTTFTKGGISLSDIYNMTFSEFIFWFNSCEVVSNEINKEIKKASKK